MKLIRGAQKMTKEQKAELKKMGIHSDNKQKKQLE